MQHPTSGVGAQQADAESVNSQRPAADVAGEGTPESPTGALIGQGVHGAPSRRRPGRPTASTPIGDLETRELVLRQARRLFMQRGYASVAVGEVAQAVGVTKPTLYYHFGDKEGLYAAVLVDLMHEVGGYIAAVIARHESVRTRLEEIALGYFLNANGTMEPMLRDVAQLIGEKRADAVWAAYEDEFFGPMVELMRQGSKTGEIGQLDPRLLARAFLGLLDALTARGGKSVRTPEEHAQVAGQVVSLFLGGAATSA